MQQSSKTQVSVKKREEKDYLYINMWLLLMIPGVIILGVVYLFPQLFDVDTISILALVGTVLTLGCCLCVRKALEPGVQQSRIVAWFVFSLSLLAVVVGVIAVYDNKKIIVILSLLMTVPISFFSSLPTFYYGDRRENEL